MSRRYQTYGCQFCQRFPRTGENFKKKLDQRERGTCPSNTFVKEIEPFPRTIFLDVFTNVKFLFHFLDKMVGKVPFSTDDNKDTTIETETEKWCYMSMQHDFYVRGNNGASETLGWQKRNRFYCSTWQMMSCDGKVRSCDWKVRSYKSFPGNETGNRKALDSDVSHTLAIAFADLGASLLPNFLYFNVFGLISPNNWFVPTPVGLTPLPSRKSWIHRYIAWTIEILEWCWSIINWSIRILSKQKRRLKKERSFPQTRSLTLSSYPLRIETL